MPRVRPVIVAVRRCFTGLRLILCVLLIAGLLFTIRYRLSVWNSMACLSISLEGGAIRCYWWTYRWPMSPLRWPRDGWDIALNPAQPFVWLPWLHHESPSSHRIDMPLWVVLAPALAPSAIFAWRQARRRARGECARCAYDLRGLPPGAPCPECGTPRQSEVSHAP